MGAFGLYQNGGIRESKVPLAGAAPGGQDQLTLSLAYLEEQTRRAWELSAMEQQMGTSSNESSQLEALKDAMEVLKACAKIAASIMKGDEVPLKDLRYLMEHDSQGYQLAMAMRRTKEDPEKCKSVVPDEKQQGQRSSSVEAPTGGPSGGGGGESVAPSGGSSSSGGASASGSGPEG